MRVQGRSRPAWVLFALLAAAAPLASGESPPAEQGSFDLKEFVGKISCGASAASVQTGDPCSEIDSDPKQDFRLDFRKGLTALVIETKFSSPQAAAALKELRVEIDPPVDEKKTTAWEAPSGSRLILMPIQSKVAEGTTSKTLLIVKLPQDHSDPSVAYENSFYVAATSFYGMTPPQDYSAYAKRNSPESPKQVEPPEAAPTSNADVEPAAVDEATTTASRERFHAQAWTYAFSATAAGAAAWVLAPRLRRSVFLLFPLFTRLDEDRVLEHPRRALILRVLKAEPGLPSEEARRRTGLSNGVFEYHLRVLESRRHVRRYATEGRTLLFPSGAVLPRPATPAHPVKQLILEEITRSPGERPVDLARRLGLAEKTVRYHTLWMARTGVICLSDRDGVLRCYTTQATP